MKKLICLCVCLGLCLSAGIGMAKSYDCVITSVATVNEGTENERRSMAITCKGTTNLELNDKIKVRVKTEILEGC